MDAKHKFELITRDLQEVVGEDKLKEIPQLPVPLISSCYLQNLQSFLTPFGDGVECTALFTKGLCSGFAACNLMWSRGGLGVRGHSHHAKART
jgi:hypothetical protein